MNASTIATNVNVSLSSSEQVTPNFWTDPTSAAVLRRLDGEVIGNSVSSLNDLANTPVSTVQDLDHLAMFGLPRRSLQGESSASEGIATASS